MSRRSRTTVTRCGRSPKRRFRDAREADRALRSIINKSHQREETPVRKYLCDHCQGYHLTSWGTP